MAGPTVQRTGSRSFPIASASSMSRAVVVVRHAKRCSDTGIPALTPEFLTPEFLRDTGIPTKRCSDTGFYPEFLPRRSTWAHFTFDHEGVLLISDKINGTVGFHEALLH